MSFRAYPGSMLHLDPTILPHRLLVLDLTSFSPLSPAITPTLFGLVRLGWLNR